MRRAVFVAGALMAGAAAPQAVSVKGAWARASLPGQDMAAVYVTLTSAADDTLTGVDAMEGTASLHRTVRAGAMERMEDVASIPLPGGTPVALAPGGAHIMLMLPEGHPLREGGTVRLKFRFAHAAPEQVDVPVRPARATGP